MLNSERQDNGTMKKKLLCHNFDLTRLAQPLTNIKRRHKSNENIRGNCWQKKKKVTVFIKWSGFTTIKYYSCYTKSMYSLIQKIRLENAYTFAICHQLLRSKNWHSRKSIFPSPPLAEVETKETILKSSSEAVKHTTQLMVVTAISLE